MRTLDRYLLRETLAPFAIALAALSFILIIPSVISSAETLIARGLPAGTVGEVLLTLLPPVLGLTLPMAYLIAVLVALSRLSVDREIVVMMACGIGPFQLLRPLLALAVVCSVATSWVMIAAVPTASLHYRELALRLMADRAETEVRARQFFEDLPDTVLYVRDTPRAGGWRHVFAARTNRPGHTDVYVADRGRLLVDRGARRIAVVLQDGIRHTTGSAAPAKYEQTRFDEVIIALDPDRAFREMAPREARELSIAELRERRAARATAGAPTHNETIEIHRKFSVPAACFVFALIGAGLGLSNRNDGKLGGFVVGILVIFGYYAIMYTAHAAAKGGVIPAWSAMWLPNLILGAVGAGLLAWRAGRIGAFFSIAWRAGRRQTPHDARPASPRLRAPSLFNLRLPRPKLLDLYVTALYTRVMLLASAGLLGLFYLSTFIDRADKWFKGQIALGLLLEFMAWSTPQFVFYILAMAVLLATLITVVLLTKRSELIAMHACGISLYRNAAPLVVLAAISGGLMFAIQERVLPVTNPRAAFLQHVINGNPPQTFDVIRNRQWLVGSREEIYHYDHFDAGAEELHRLTVFEFDDAGSALTSLWYADHASHVRDDHPPDAGRWRTTDGWRRDFRAAGHAAFATLGERLTRIEPAAYFITDVPGPDRMRFSELRSHVGDLAARGYGVVEYEVALHRKIAFPFMPVIMTLVAIPFAIMAGRRGTMYGVGIGVALGLSYWMLSSFSAALGVAGVWPPAVAAWSPNLLFGTAALGLILTART